MELVPLYGTNGPFGVDGPVIGICPLVDAVELPGSFGETAVVLTPGNGVANSGSIPAMQPAARGTGIWMIANLLKNIATV